MPWDSPEVLFCFSPADKSFKYHLGRVSKDASRFSVSPQEVLPFAFPSYSPPQDSNELVGAWRLQVGLGAVRGRQAGAEGSPTWLVSVPLPPPRRLLRETCAQVIMMNGKPGSTCCHLPVPWDTCAELASPNLPKLETAEPPGLPGNGVWGLNSKQRTRRT